MENELNQTVEKLLSDPEMLAKIKSIASSVSMSQNAASPQSTPGSQVPPNLHSILPDTASNSPNNINLKNFSALISSLCPFLDADKRTRAEHLLELIRLAQTAGALGNLIK